MDVQYAIWYLIHGKGYLSGGAQTLVDNAENHSDFCPDIGQKFVVLLTKEKIPIYGVYSKGSSHQPLLIEVERVSQCRAE